MRDAEKNARTLELFHAWTDAQKAAYNREYYRKNKWRWENGGGSSNLSGSQYPDARSKWQLDLARRNEELDDNADRIRKSWKREDSLKDDLRNVKAAQYNYEKWHKGEPNYKNPWDDTVKEYERRANAAAGDFHKDIAMRDIHWNNQVRNAPSATMKTPSETKHKINRTKRKLVSVAKVVGSKAHSAGKAFIDNWKAGIG